MKLRGITGKKQLFWASITILLVLLSSWGKIVTDAQLPPSPSKPSPETDSTPSPTPTEPTVIPNKINASPEKWRMVGLVQTFEGQKSTPDSLIFSPDSQYLIAGGNFTDPNLRIWSVKSGKRVAQIRAQRLSVQALAIAPNGSTLISSGEDGAINAWDWPTGKYLGISLAHNTQVMALAITPDGQILVSGALDGIRVWTLTPRRPLYRLAWIGYPTFALSINPADGITLATGDNEGKIRFWNLREGKLISEFSPHQEPISGVLFTPDGKYLITASQDRTIKIWDAETQELLYTLIGHKGRIRSLSIHPSGTILASASNDGVRLWNIETGELLNWLNNGQDWVQTIAFSPDGQYLASGSFDFKIRLWQPGVQNQPEVEASEK